MQMRPQYLKINKKQPGGDRCVRGVTLCLTRKGTCRYLHGVGLEATEKSRRLQEGPGTRKAGVLPYSVPFVDSVTKWTMSCVITD